MRKVVLFFSKASRIAEFILENRIGGALVCSTEQSLSAILFEDLIVLACTKYGALLHKPPLNYLSDYAKPV
jgi:hypothetical protein